MTTKRTPISPPRITPRILELLRSLDLCPLDTGQLLRLSSTWAEPFTSDSRLRHVLRRLIAAGWVSASPYAIASRGGSPMYYKLTRRGYRIAFGEDVPLPKRRYFEPIGIALHQHTRSLADVIVHLIVTTADCGIRVNHYQRENTHCVRVGNDTVYPDWSFVLAAPGRRPVRFVLELDNGTERVSSAMDVESIERKVRVYDLSQRSLKAFDPDRFVVLFVTTRGRVRVQHILETAATVVSNPERKLVCAIDLQTFLGQKNPVLNPSFFDHNFEMRSLLRPEAIKDKIVRKQLAPALALC